MSFRMEWRREKCGICNWWPPNLGDLNPFRWKSRNSSFSVSSSLFTRDDDDEKQNRWVGVCFGSPPPLTPSCCFSRIFTLSPSPSHTGFLMSRNWIKMGEGEIRGGGGREREPTTIGLALGKDPRLGEEIAKIASDGWKKRPRDQEIWITVTQKPGNCGLWKAARDIRLYLKDKPICSRRPPHSGNVYAVFKYSCLPPKDLKLSGMSSVLRPNILTSLSEKNE